jgi:RNA polymerase sigma-70 factor (ECF subfamily)
MKKEFNRLDDRELVALYRSGNTEAFGMLIKRHSRKLSYIIYPFFKDPSQVQDVLHDSFIKAMEALERGAYNEEGNFMGWMTNLIKNFCVDKVRARKRKDIIYNYAGDAIPEQLFFYNKAIDKSPTPEEELITRENRARLHCLIEKLPSEQKAVLLLRVYSGLSFKKICMITGVNEPVNLSTCLGRMRYAIANLKKMSGETV